MPTIDLTKLTKDEIKTMHKGLNKVLKGEGKKICKTCFEVRELAKDYNYAFATKPRADCKKCQASKQKLSYAERGDDTYRCGCGEIVKSKNKYGHSKTLKHKTIVSNLLTVHFD